MKRIAVCLLLAVPIVPQAAPVQAQHFTVDAHMIDRCLPVHDSPMSCVGIAADTCVENYGGGPNMVHAACIDAEFAYWDGALNSAYAHILGLARERETMDLGYAPESLVNALREMQRSWIVYRDATCHHMVALDTPFGSAAGLSYAECMMFETARQNFVLRDLRFAYVDR